MKRTILAIAFSALSATSFANGNGPVASAGAAAQANASAAAVGLNHNSVTGYTSGYAVGNANSSYGVGGNATALSGQGGTAYGGSGGTVFSFPYQGVNINAAPPAQQTVTNNGRTQIETVPNIYAPNIYPTAPCMGSTSAGAGWLGFGMSGGTSWTDRECQLMEASRNAPTPADRIYVWCKSESAKGAPSCAGLQPEPAATTGSVPTERDRRADATVRTGGGAPGADVWSGR